MSEQPPRRSMAPSELTDRLHQIAQLLRTSHHLGPESRQALAALADELGDTLDQSTAAPTETAHLVDSTAQVVRALHQDHDTGPLAAARQRLEESVAQFQARAPNAADFARRLLDALANLGI